MVKEISRKNRQTKSFGCHLMVSWKFPFTVIRIQEVKKSVLLQRAESSLILAISYRPKFSVLTKVLSYRPDLLYHLPELASDSQIFFFCFPLFSILSPYFLHLLIIPIQVIRNSYIPKLKLLCLPTHFHKGMCLTICVLGKKNLTGSKCCI